MKLCCQINPVFRCRWCEGNLCDDCMDVLPHFYKDSKKSGNQMRACSCGQTKGHIGKSDWDIRPWDYCCDEECD